MPTRAQMNSVTERIEALESERFQEVDEVMRRSDSPDAVPWGDLDHDQQLEALHSEVDWSGFDVDQMVEIATRVADGDPFDFWMGEIVASDQREVDLAAMKEHEEERMGRDFSPWAPAESAAAEPDPFVERETKLRELFDTSNRVMAAKYIQDHNLDLGVATRSSDQVREAIIKEAEKTWDHVREEGMFRTDAEIDETLRMFREMEAALEPSRTIMDVPPGNGALHGPRPRSDARSRRAISANPPPHSRTDRVLPARTSGPATLRSWISGWIRAATSGRSSSPSASGSSRRRNSTTRWVRARP